MALSDVVKKHLDAAIAEAGETGYGAGDVARTIEQLRLSAAAAARLFRPREAANILLRALELLATEPESGRRFSNIAIADDQYCRMLLGDSSPDLLPDGVIGAIDLDAETLGLEPTGYLRGIVEVAVGNRNDGCLHRGQPAG